MRASSESSVLIVEAAVAAAASASADAGGDALTEGLMSVLFIARGSEGDKGTVDGGRFD